jgi:hypothetical protein
MQVCAQNPLISSFSVSCFKSGLSDIVAQKIVEDKENLDLKRTVVFASFGGWYGGWFQHYVYNLWYPMLFGRAATFWPTVKKIAADNFFMAPFIAIPTYYTWRMALLPDAAGSPNSLEEDIFAAWKRDVVMVTVAFWKIWIPAHVVTFGFVAEPLRITWVASVSFVWLIIKSVLAHGSYENIQLQLEADREAQTTNA